MSSEMGKVKRGLAFVSGVAIGSLGGLIGLGGAEFRLPLLIGIFGFGPLEAVILNKGMSLIVVAVALPARAAVVPFARIFSYWSVIVTLICGSVSGAWWGAGFATKLQPRAFYMIIAVLLVSVAGVLLFCHGTSAQQVAFSGLLSLIVVGVVAGFGIGVFAALLGVAGGELLIPTIVFLFGIDIKLAGRLSLAVSIPTMITSFSRYSRDMSFQVVRREWPFIAIMAAGSVVGSWLGGRLLGVVPNSVLLPLLAAILVISAVQVWRHSKKKGTSIRSYNS